MYNGAPSYKGTGAGEDRRAGPRTSPPQVSAPDVAALVTGAGERDELFEAASSINDAHAAAERPGTLGNEPDLDGTTGSSGERGGTVIGLPKAVEAPSDRDGCDAHRGVAEVGEEDNLRCALGAYLSRRKVQL